MKIKSLEFVKGAALWEQLPDDNRPEVAFVGRSNVGKSSLLNMLVGRKGIARISKSPGKTQEFNYYLVNGGLYLVDLPGFGYAKIARTKREKWALLLRRYMLEREPLRLVCHLVDSRHPPTKLDIQIIEFMRGGHTPYLIIMTKADKISGNQRQKQINGVNDVLKSYNMEVPIVLTSSKTKRGHQEVWNWIRDMAGI